MGERGETMTDEESSLPLFMDLLTVLRKLLFIIVSFESCKVSKSFFRLP